MGPKKQKRQRRTSKTTASTDDEAGRSPKRMRKVVIDESEGSAEPAEGTEVAAAESINPPVEEDEVVSEVGVYLLPLAPKFGGGPTTAVSINRLQFSQQHPYLLRRRFRGDCDDGQEGKQCFAEYKAQVKHLRLGFGSPVAEDEAMGMSTSSSSTFGGGGLAELLTRSDKLATPKASTSSSSHSSTRNSANDLVFNGEGFSQHNLLSHAVGFFSGGRLFLLPVDKTYEMRKPLVGTIEKEAARAAQKAQSNTSLKSAGSASAAPAPSSSLAPLRVRYARAENELQRRRREQSSLYKQKLVDQDQWIPMGVQHAKVTELFAEEISQASATTSSSGTSTQFVSQ